MKAVIETPGSPLRSEMTGQAKILCGKRRILDLMTRRITRYLRVEFWSWWCGEPRPAADFPVDRGRPSRHTQTHLTFSESRLA
ncbi:MAG: hypothetical protein ACRD6R_00160 [Candidatus Polarisedimenticolia bacterium]